jgi:hypothetical protein
MANTNCLEGIRCPKCGQEDEFRIACTMVCTVIDDGTEKIGDIEWDENSWCLCPRCEKDGKLKDFQS